MLCKLKLAHYVDRLEDENDGLRKLMGWLFGDEPQLNMMIAKVKRLGLARMESVVVREMGKLGAFLFYYKLHPRTNLHLSKISS
jgi:hypothetical protein